MKELRMDNGDVDDARSEPTCEECGRPLAAVNRPRGVWACYSCSTRYRVRRDV